jgi:methylated-DNA-[protein]-cysteine S-methyltransferase
VSGATAERLDVQHADPVPTIASVRFAVVPAPWGPIHLAADDEAVLALELMTPTNVFAATLERRLRRSVALAAPTRPSSVLAGAVDQVEAFLRGELRSLDVPFTIDDRPEWDRAVLGAVRTLDWGTVTSYGRLARRIGRPGAARAAGGAVGRNPIGLVIPCHRVIAGDGSIGGYGGGWYGTREQLLEIKRALLAREGIELPARALVE